MNAYSVRGLSKQGLTCPSRWRWRGGPPSRNGLWFGPRSPQGSAALPPRENTPAAGTPGQAAARTQTRAGGQQLQAERLGGDTAAGVRLGPPLGQRGGVWPVAQRLQQAQQEHAEISPESTVLLREQLQCHLLRILSLRWGLLLRNLESHSPTGSVLPTGNHWKHSPS